MGEGETKIKEMLLDKFAELFGDADGVKVYFAPGRVNLIGEHTDYTKISAKPRGKGMNSYVQEECLGAI